VIIITKILIIKKVSIKILNKYFWSNQNQCFLNYNMHPKIKIHFLFWIPCLFADILRKNLKKKKLKDI